jgi:hypothetical protein
VIARKIASLVAGAVSSGVDLVVADRRHLAKEAK